MHAFFLKILTNLCSKFARLFSFKFFFFGGGGDGVNSLVFVSFVSSFENASQHATLRSRFRCHVLNSAFTTQEYDFYVVVKVATVQCQHLKILN